MKRLYLVILCFLCTMSTYAQTKKSIKQRKGSVAYNIQNKKGNDFLNKQWWIGLKAGTNLSAAVVETPYSSFSPSYDASTTLKRYDNFKQPGTQATLEVTFYFRRLALSLQPTYRHSRFVYRNQYEWTDNLETNNRLILNYEQEQKIDHAIIPLVAKFDVTQTRLRPYVQAGVYAAFLVNANKAVNITGIDYASGGVNEFSNEPIVVGAEDLFAKNHWGLIGGAGVNYTQGNVRLNLDVMYQYGMSLINSTKNRFSDDRLAGAGDVMDDISLNNIMISVGCLFPLRFLEDGFKSMDRK